MKKVIVVYGSSEISLRIPGRFSYGDVKAEAVRHFDIAPYTNADVHSIDRRESNSGRQFVLTNDAGNVFNDNEAVVLGNSAAQTRLSMVLRDGLVHAMLPTSKDTGLPAGGIKIAVEAALASASTTAASTPVQHFPAPSGATSSLSAVAASLTASATAMRVGMSMQSPERSPYPRSVQQAVLQRNASSFSLTKASSVLNALNSSPFEVPLPATVLVPAQPRRVRPRSPMLAGPDMLQTLLSIPPPLLLAAWTAMSRATVGYVHGAPASLPRPATHVPALPLPTAAYLAITCFDRVSADNVFTIKDVSRILLSFLTCLPGWGMPGEDGDENAIWVPLPALLEAMTHIARDAAERKQQEHVQQALAAAPHAALDADTLIRLQSLRDTTSNRLRNRMVRCLVHALREGVVHGQPALAMTPTGLLMPPLIPAPLAHLAAACLHARSLEAAAVPAAPAALTALLMPVARVIADVMFRQGSNDMLMSGRASHLGLRNALDLLCTAYSNAGEHARNGLTFHRAMSLASDLGWVKTLSLPLSVWMATFLLVVRQTTEFNALGQGWPMHRNDLGEMTFKNEPSRRAGGGFEASSPDGPLGEEDMAITPPAHSPTETDTSWRSSLHQQVLHTMLSGDCLHLWLTTVATAHALTALTGSVACASAEPALCTLPVLIGISAKAKLQLIINAAMVPLHQALLATVPFSVNSAGAPGSASVCHRILTSTSDPGLPRCSPLVTIATCATLASTLLMLQLSASGLTRSRAELLVHRCPGETARSRTSVGSPWPSRQLLEAGRALSPRFFKLRAADEAGKDLAPWLCQEMASTFGLRVPSHSSSPSSLSRRTDGDSPFVTNSRPLDYISVAAALHGSVMELLTRGNVLAAIAETLTFPVFRPDADNEHEGKAGDLRDEEWDVRGLPELDEEQQQAVQHLIACVPVVLPPDSDRLANSYIQQQPQASPTGCTDSDEKEKGSQILTKTIDGSKYTAVPVVILLSDDLGPVRSANEAVADAVTSVRRALGWSSASRRGLASMEMLGRPWAPRDAQYAASWLEHDDLGTDIVAEPTSIEGYERPLSDVVACLGLSLGTSPTSLLLEHAVAMMIEAASAEGMTTEAVRALMRSLPAPAPHPDFVRPQEPSNSVVKAGSEWQVAKIGNQEVEEDEDQDTTDSETEQLRKAVAAVSTNVGSVIPKLGSPPSRVGTRVSRSEQAMDGHVDELTADIDILCGSEAEDNDEDVPKDVKLPVPVHHASFPSLSLPTRVLPSVARATLPAQRAQVVAVWSSPESALFRLQRMLKTLASVHEVLETATNAAFSLHRVRLECMPIPRTSDLLPLVEHTAGEQAEYDWAFEAGAAILRSGQSDTGSILVEVNSLALVPPASTHSFNRHSSVRSMRGTGTSQDGVASLAMTRSSIAWGEYHTALACAAQADVLMEAVAWKCVADARDVAQEQLARSGAAQWPQGEGERHVTGSAREQAVSTVHVQITAPARSLTSISYREAACEADSLLSRACVHVERAMFVRTPWPAALQLHARLLLRRACLHFPTHLSATASAQCAAHLRLPVPSPPGLLEVVQQLGQAQRQQAPSGQDELGGSAGMECNTRVSLSATRTVTTPYHSRHTAVSMLTTARAAALAALAAVSAGEGAAEAQAPTSVAQSMQELVAVTDAAIVARGMLVTSLRLPEVQCGTDGEGDDKLNGIDSEHANACASLRVVTDAAACRGRPQGEVGSDRRKGSQAEQGINASSMEHPLLGPPTWTSRLILPTYAPAHVTDMSDMEVGGFRYNESDGSASGIALAGLTLPGMFVAWRLFQLFDRDGDGLLTGPELACAWTALGPAMDPVLASWAREEEEAMPSLTVAPAYGDGEGRVHMRCESPASRAELAVTRATRCAAVSAWFSANFSTCYAASKWDTLACAMAVRTHKSPLDGPESAIAKTGEEDVGKTDFVDGRDTAERSAPTLSVAVWASPVSSSLETFRRKSTSRASRHTYKAYSYSRRTATFVRSTYLYCAGAVQSRNFPRLRCSTSRPAHGGGGQEDRPIFDRTIDAFPSFLAAAVDWRMGNNLSTQAKPVRRRTRFLSLIRARLRASTFTSLDVPIRHWVRRIPTVTRRPASAFTACIGCPVPTSSISALASPPLLITAAVACAIGAIESDEGNKFVDEAVQLSTGLRGTGGAGIGFPAFAEFVAWLGTTDPLKLTEALLRAGLLALSGPTSAQLSEAHWAPHALATVQRDGGRSAYDESLLRCLMSRDDSPRCLTLSDMVGTGASGSCGQTCDHIRLWLHPRSERGGGDDDAEGDEGDEGDEGESGEEEKLEAAQEMECESNRVDTHDIVKSVSGVPVEEGQPITPMDWDESSATGTVTSTDWDKEEVESVSSRSDGSISMGSNGRGGGGGGGGSKKIRLHSNVSVEEEEEHAVIGVKVRSSTPTLHGVSTNNGTSSRRHRRQDLPVPRPLSQASPRKTGDAGTIAALSSALPGTALQLAAARSRTAAAAVAAASDTYGIASSYGFNASTRFSVPVPGGSLTEHAGTSGGSTQVKSCWPGPALEAELLARAAAEDEARENGIRLAVHAARMEERRRKRALRMARQTRAATGQAAPRVPSRAGTQGHAAPRPSQSLPTPLAAGRTRADSSVQSVGSAADGISLGMRSVAVRSRRAGSQLDGALMSMSTLRPRPSGSRFGEPLPLLPVQSRAPASSFGTARESTPTPTGSGTPARRPSAATNVSVDSRASTSMASAVKLARIRAGGASYIGATTSADIVTRPPHEVGLAPARGPIAGGRGLAMPVPVPPVAETYGGKISSPAIAQKGSSGLEGSVLTLPCPGPPTGLPAYAFDGSYAEDDDEEDGQAMEDGGGPGKLGAAAALAIGPGGLDATPYAQRNSLVTIPPKPVPGMAGLGKRPLGSVATVGPVIDPAVLQWRKTDAACADSMLITPGLGTGEQSTPSPAPQGKTAGGGATMASAASPASHVTARMASLAAGLVARLKLPHTRAILVPAALACLARTAARRARVTVALAQSGVRAGSKAMRRGPLGGPPPRLFEYYAAVARGAMMPDIIACDTDSPYDLEYSPILSARVPREDWRGCPLPANVGLFAFPEGFRLSPGVPTGPSGAMGPPPPRRITFVLTGEDGSRLHASAIVVWEALHADPQELEAALQPPLAGPEMGELGMGAGSRAGAGPMPGHFPLPLWLDPLCVGRTARSARSKANGSVGLVHTVYTPKAHILVSRVPCYALLQAALKQLVGIGSAAAHAFAELGAAMDSSTAQAGAHLLPQRPAALAAGQAAIDHAVTPVILDVPLPPRGWASIGFTLGTAHLVAARPPPNALPLLDVPLAPLFQCLDAGNVLAAVTAALCERRIALCSRHISLLTPVAESLVALCFPFRWVANFIPLLPSCMAEIMGAPTPYLLGWPGTVDEAQAFSAETVFVDLDRNAVLAPAYAPLPRLPEAQRKKLLRALSIHAYGNSGGGPALGQVAPGGPQQKSNNYFTGFGLGGVIGAGTGTHAMYGADFNPSLKAWIAAQDAEYASTGVQDAALQLGMSPLAAAGLATLHGAGAGHPQRQGLPMGSGGGQNKGPPVPRLAPPWHEAVPGASSGQFYGGTVGLSALASCIEGEGSAMDRLNRLSFGWQWTQETGKRKASERVGSASGASSGDDGIGPGKGSVRTAGKKGLGGDSDKAGSGVSGRESDHGKGKESGSSRTALAAVLSDGESLIGFGGEVIRSPLQPVSGISASLSGEEAGRAGRERERGEGMDADGIPGTHVGTGLSSTFHAPGIRDAFTRLLLSLFKGYAKHVRYSRIGTASDPASAAAVHRLCVVAHARKILQPAPSNEEGLGSALPPFPPVPLPVLAMEFDSAAFLAEVPSGGRDLIRCVLETQMWQAFSQSLVPAVYRGIPASPPPSSPVGLPWDPRVEDPAFATRLPAIVRTFNALINAKLNRMAGQRLTLGGLRGKAAPLDTSFLDSSTARIAVHVAFPPPLPSAASVPPDVGAALSALSAMAAAVAASSTPQPAPGTQGTARVSPDKDMKSGHGGGLDAVDPALLLSPSGTLHSSLAGPAGMAAALASAKAFQGRRMSRVGQGRGTGMRARNGSRIAMALSFEGSVEEKNRDKERGQGGQHAGARMRTTAPPA